MATHRTDVSVLFGVPTDPADDHLGGPLDLELAGDVLVPMVASAAPKGVADLIGLQPRVAFDRLRTRGIDARVKVLSQVPGPSGLVIWQRPRAGGSVIDGEVATLGVAPGTLVQVPDVRLRTERDACLALEAMAIVPGQRDPAPRPASGRPEVVIRTHPAIGSAVPVGSTVDYDMAPGEPREPNGGDDRDVEGAPALGLDADAATGEPDHTAAPPPSKYIDYDAIDTLFRFGCQPVEARA